MAHTRRPNRGPSAAAENRAALIEAARELFATDGFDAPLTSIARAAGVGQGSLYRHFPDRVSLALAVFDDGIKALEALATDPAATLDDVLALTTDQAIASTAFIAMVSATDPRIMSLRYQVEALLEGPLARAREAGRVREHVTAEDLVTALGMIAAIATELGEELRRHWAEYDALPDLADRPP
ncbi:TetR family transcriptional regulator, partial [Nonomuraea sp. NPDC003201]